MPHSLNVDGLIQVLFEPEKRRLAGVITELNRKNKQLKDNTVDGFLFMGKHYLPSNVSTVITGPGQARVPLDYSLHQAMELWIRDQKIIREDQIQIKQMLFRLVKDCKSHQQLRNALPECLVGMISNLSAFDRTDETAYTLQGDERALRQFNKLLPKIELYSAVRLFY